jgi:hypothetical protein
MEIKKYGTFNMTVGRPIDALRFEKMNGKQIVFQQVGDGDMAMPVQSIVKMTVDPHPDYFNALDSLVPFACKIMDLGPHWSCSSIGSLKLDWTYNNNTEKFTYKIDSITIARPSHLSELAIPRMMSFGGIVIDDIPCEFQDAIENIMDQAYLYVIGKKTAQLNLFDVQSKPELDSAVLTVIRGEVIKALESRGVHDEGIELYLEFAGDSPSIEGFFEWSEDGDIPEEKPEIVPPASKQTRSKAKKGAV